MDVGAGSDVGSGALSRGATAGSGVRSAEGSGAAFCQLIVLSIGKAEPEFAKASTFD